MNRRDFLVSSALAGAAAFTGSGCRPSARVQGKAGAGGAAAAATQSGDQQAAQEIDLTAEPVDVDLGDGVTFAAFGYNGRTPGPEIRVTEGQLVRINVHNNLPADTTIHWHGLPVPNAMDGVPDVTQEPIGPGGTYTYEFVARPAGTYVYHSHVGYQLDQGLHGSLVVEERRQVGHDREFVLALEDWAAVDGAGPAASRNGRVQGRGMMGGMMGRGRMMGRRGMMGQRATSEDLPLLEPRYDAYAANGKLASAAEPLEVRQGDKVKLRLINASSSSIYYVRLSGHALSVTHCDGRPVEPVEVDALRIGMGERYDVEFIADNPGRWQLLIWPDTAQRQPYPIRTVLYRSVNRSDFTPDANSRGRMLGYDSLQAKDEPTYTPVGEQVDKVFRMVLSGGMHSRYWTINGRVYPDSDDLRISPGERVRLEYANHSMMPHPMHLHGHFFELDLPGRPRKDTVIVESHMGSMALEFVADNPGDWFHHCHNLYHLGAGMANIVHNR